MLAGSLLARVSAGGVSAGGVSAGGVSAGGVSAGGVSAGGVSAGGVSSGGGLCWQCRCWRLALVLVPGVVLRATPFPSSLSPPKRPPLHLQTVATGGGGGDGQGAGERVGCADWVRRLQCRRPLLACPAGASVGVDELAGASMGELAGASVGELSGTSVGELAGASVGEPAGVLVGGSDGGVADVWANALAISLAGRWRFRRGLLAGPLAFAIAPAAAVMMSAATRRDGRERSCRGARH
ncbi:unnamed protein product [Closterium sp. Naga37s-1]|nr:unnamed protein product [Closterium sp. Naga37s-1]